MKMRPAAIIVLCCLPWMLWAVGGIGPTFDDFLTLQSPQTTPFNPSLLLPTDSFWRPFDYLFGCLLGRHTALFPLLNHVVIIAGHTLGTFLIYKICRLAHLGSFAAQVGALFFFFSPAALGTTLACDGLNQTFAQLWGLLALWCYMKGHRRLWLWPLFTLMAALSKENGLAWAVVPPLVAFAFHKTERKTLLRHLGMGMLVAATYFAARLLLTTTANVNSEYTDTTLSSHLKDLAQLLAYNLLPADYMSLFFAPQRSWLLIVLTLLLPLPFLAMVASRWRQLLHRTLAVLVACFFILASPHLLTLVSIMHNYAPLSMTAIIVAFLSQQIPFRRRLLAAAFGLYLLAAAITAIHHTIGARQSGQVARRMAQAAIEKTGKPVGNVFCISIDDGSAPRYSSFGVAPVDAFAGGLAVEHYTHYEWPKTTADTLLTVANEERTRTLADSALRAGYDCVWVAGPEETVGVYLR